MKTNNISSLAIVAVVVLVCFVIYYVFNWIKSTIPSMDKLFTSGNENRTVVLNLNLTNVYWILQAIHLQTSLLLEILC